MKGVTKFKAHLDVDGWFVVRVLPNGVWSWWAKAESEFRAKQIVVLLKKGQKAGWIS